MSTEFQDILAALRERIDTIIVNYTIAYGLLMTKSNDELVQLYLEEEEKLFPGVYQSKKYPYNVPKWDVPSLKILIDPKIKYTGYTMETYFDNPEERKKLFDIFMVFVITIKEFGIKRTSLQNGKH
jgi:hypothetical protein